MIKKKNLYKNFIYRTKYAIIEERIRNTGDRIRKLVIL